MRSLRDTGEPKHQAQEVSIVREDWPAILIMAKTLGEQAVSAPSSL